MQAARRINWTIVLPVGLIALALLGVLWFDLTTGGEAKPEAYLGAIGTPVRGTFVAPPATPTTDATARPTAVVTVPPGAEGSAADRDQRRRTDVLVLYQAANTLKERDGSFPSTNGNVQTVCTYKDVDAACKLAEVLPGDIPHDPFGANAGYWYSSDGQSVAIYASLEGDIPDGQKCNTDDAELVKHANVICVRGP